MAATARLTAVSTISIGASPRSTPTTKMRAQIASTAMARRRPKADRRRCSGVPRSDLLVQQAGHLAELGAHARRDHQAAAPPVGGRGSLEGHVQPVAQCMQLRR